MRIIYIQQYMMIFEKQQITQIKYENIDDNNKENTNEDIIIIDTNIRLFIKENILYETYPICIKEEKYYYKNNKYHYVTVII